jgi:hypothetical protein
MKNAMAVAHDRDKGSLYVALPSAGEQVAVSREVHPGVVLYLDAHGTLLGLELDEGKARAAAVSEPARRH